MSDTTKEAKTPPAYGRPLQDIIKDLSTEVPATMLASKTLKGTKITFIPWYQATRLLDYYAPGWEYEVRGIVTVKDQLIVTVRLTIHAAEGSFTREATGIEDEEVSGYGDPISNACSMALRRAAAHFGLGRYLYIK